MRNLKKILSLALALVMVFSLMTFASAQDFNDAADIEHTEAVEVLTALEVIDGVGNNTFNPTGNVTRAQMAKMITLISLGNVSPDAFLGTTTDLTDINGHWAEAYIKYCYAQGIISGKGNGRFDPDANVTTVEAAKMLLVAIGYNSDVQVYEGPQWNINVIRDASDSEFFKEVALPANQTLNRDQASQMIYNALNALVIDKTSEVSRVDGSIIDSYQKSRTGQTLLGKAFKGLVWIGTFDGNKSTGDASAAGEIKVTGRIEGTDNGKVPAFFPSDFDISHIGEEVKVIFKDGTSGSPNKPDKNDTIYGVYTTGATTVYNITKADIQDAKDDAKSSKGKIKFGGTKYEVADDMTWILNYENETETAIDASVINKNKADENGWRLQSTDSIKFVCNDEGKIQTAYVVTYTLGRVNSVTSDKITISGIGAIEFDGNDIADGLAKDDVVVYTRFYKNANADKDDAYFTVSLAETVEGKLTGFKMDGSNYENVVVEGTTYKVDGKPGQIGSNSLTDDALTTPKDSDIDDQVRLYLVNGMVGAIKSIEESGGKYALIVDKDTGDGTIGDGLNPVKLKVLLTDGSTETVTVHKDSKKNNYKGTEAKDLVDVTETDLKIGTMVEYTNISNGVIKIKTIAKTGTTTTIAANSNIWNKDSKSLIYDGSKSAVAASNATLFVCVDNGKTPGSADKNDDFYAYKLRDVGNLAGSGSTVKVQYYLDDGQIVAAYLLRDSKPKGSTASTLYGIVTGFTGTRTKDDTTYDVYTVAVGRESDVTVWVENGSTPVGPQIQKKALVTFEETIDGLYDYSDFTVLVIDKDQTTNRTGYEGWVLGAAEKYDASARLLTYYTKTEKKGENNYEGKDDLQSVTVSKDVVIVYVDADNTKGVYEYGAIDSFSKLNGYANVLFHQDANDNGIVDAIIVETSGEANLATYLQNKKDHASTNFPIAGGEEAKPPMAAVPDKTEGKGTIAQKDGNAAYNVEAKATGDDSVEISVNRTTALDGKNTHGEKITVTYKVEPQGKSRLAAGTYTKDLFFTKGGASETIKFTVSDVAGMKVTVTKIEVTAASAAPSEAAKPTVSGPATTAEVGDTLTVAATVGEGELSYQWYKTNEATATKGTAIKGATEATFKPTEAGKYYCVVTNTNDRVAAADKKTAEQASDLCTVSAKPDLSGIVTQDEANKTIEAVAKDGTSAYKVTATATSKTKVDVEVELTSDNANAKGETVTVPYTVADGKKAATELTFTFAANATKGTKAAKQTITITEGQTVTIGKATAAVTPEKTAETPTIETPEKTTAVVGDTLTVTASVKDSGDLSYQWYKADDKATEAKDGTLVKDETKATYKTTGAGQFYCVVTNTKDGKSSTATSALFTVSLPETSMTFALTTPDANVEGNDLTLKDKVVTVNAVNGTESVVITGTKTADQTVTLDGDNKTDVTEGANDTAPTWTVDTTAIKDSGGKKTFTLAVTETGKTTVTYTVNVTVAGA